MGMAMLVGAFVLLTLALLALGCWALRDKPDCRDDRGGPDVVPLPMGPGMAGGERVIIGPFSKESRDEIRRDYESQFTGVPAAPCCEGASILPLAVAAVLADSPESHATAPDIAPAAPDPAPAAEFTSSDWDAGAASSVSDAGGGFDGGGGGFDGGGGGGGFGD